MRPSRVLVAALLVLGMAACDDDPEVGTGPRAQPGDGTTTTSTSSPERPVGPPTLEDVGVGDPGDCDPWGPFHAVAGTYGGEPVVVGVALPDEGSIDVLARRHDAPDTDGDGEPDAVGYETGRVEVRRGDGTVSITRGDGGSVGVPGGQTWTGDLDGDGRDELVVYATHPQDVGILEVYLIPGTVPAGEHDPADVGVLLPWQPNELVWSVGDHDGDGSDDILVSGDPDPIVVPGAQLLAPGPGGTLDTDSLVPLRSAPRDLVGVLELSAGVAPVFVTATDTGGDPATRIELQVLTDPPLRLRIGGLESIGGGWGASGTASGYVSDGERIVVYRFSGGRSGYGGEWHWNLDMPCQAPVTAPDVGPLAPPQATPRRAELPATS